jgi:hypothetical protein
MFWCEIEANSGNVKMKLQNVGLKRSIKNFPSTPSMILVFSTCDKNLSSHFFDLDIENPLCRGTDPTASKQKLR